MRHRKGKHWGIGDLVSFMCLEEERLAECQWFVYGLFKSSKLNREMEEARTKLLALDMTSVSAAPPAMVTPELPILVEAPPLEVHWKPVQVSR
jgi:hypothetical protein